MALFSSKELTETKTLLVKANEQITSLQSQITELTTKLTVATTELEGLKTSNVSKAQFEELQTKLTETTNKLTEATAKVESLEKAQVTADAKALEIVAGQGVPPVPVKTTNTPVASLAPGVVVCADGTRITNMLKPKQ